MLGLGSQHDSKLLISLIEKLDVNDNNITIDEISKLYADKSYDVQNRREYIKKLEIADESSNL
jgi:hypothetical protein